MARSLAVYLGAWAVLVLGVFLLEQLPESSLKDTTTTPPPPPEEEAKACAPGYKGVCLDPDARDYDCGGGTGDGPRYVWKVVRVTGSDPFDLDRDGNGWGCE